jgi:hypothetical protein
MKPQLTEQAATVLPLAVAHAMRFDAASDDTLLPIDVVADAIGMAEGTIRQWPHRESKAPKFIRRGRFAYLRAGEVRAWLCSGSDE